MDIDRQVDLVLNHKDGGSRSKGHKRFWFMLGCSIVAFMLGTMLLIPIHGGRNGLDIIQEFFESNVDGAEVVGDPPNNSSPAYHYWYAPENSMGIKETRTVNWSYFKALFQEHFYKKALYKRYSYSEWADGTQYLTLNKTWNESGFWKVDIILDIPVDLYSVNISFGCDLQVLNYVERDGYEIWLNYTANATETYQIKFNWSDIASIPNLEISKHRTDGKFWISFKKDSVPAGLYKFDPTFGSTSTGWNQPVLYNRDERLVGSYATPYYNGTANNITVRTGSFALTQDIRCALYEYIDADTDYAGDLIAETEAKQVLDTDDNTIFTLNFSDPKPSVVDGTTYYIVVCADDEMGSGTEDNYMTCSASGTGFCIEKTSIYDFPSPLTGETEDDETLYAYCSYTSEPGYYYFNSYDAGEAWNTFPERMVDGSIGTASQPSGTGDIELCDGNTCDGTDLGTINTVKIRAYGSWGGSAGDAELQPAFSGGVGTYENCNWGSSFGWGSWINITGDTNAPSPWTWSAVDGLDCRVKATVGGLGSLNCMKVEIQVNFTEVGGETRTPTQVFDYWFNCGNETTRTPTKIFDYWFLCGNTSARVPTQAFNYYFTCENTSTRNPTQVFDYWFNCGNETVRTPTIIFTYWFNCGNETARSPTKAFNHWFSCGNTSARVPTQVFDYWFLCGNESVRTPTKVFDYYFNCGNVTVRTPTRIFNYWFNCSNVSVARTPTQIFNYYFTCGNGTTRTPTQVFNYWFACGNTSARVPTQMFDHWFACGNETVRSPTQVFNHWFACGNTSTRVPTQTFNYWFSCGNGTRSPTQTFNYWFSCGNGTVRIPTQVFNYWFACGNDSILMLLTNEYPTNGSNLFSVQPTLYFTLSNQLGGMSYSIYIGNTNTTANYLIDSDSGLSNGTYHYVNFYNASGFGTTYWWRVHYNDSSSHLNSTFSFRPVQPGGGGMGGAGSVMGVIGLVGVFGLLGFIMHRRKRER